MDDADPTDSGVPAGSGVPGGLRLDPQLGDRLLDLRGEARARRAGSGAGGPSRTRGRRTGRRGCRWAAPGSTRYEGSASRASSNASSTAEPNPPVTTLSSNVTTSDLPRAWSRISWRSSGLTNRALITPTDQPRPSNASATSSARPVIGPKVTNRRSRPSRSTSPRPIGSTSGSRSGTPKPASRGIVERERVVLGERRAEQRAQLLLVPRAGDDEVRQHPLRRDREHALVAGAVLADEARAVDREQHRGVVLAHVVDRLVERPLEERRVQRHDRAHAAEGEARGERHRVLLGDADVDEPLGVRRLELRQAGAGRHAGGDPDDPPVGLAELDQLLRRRTPCSWASSPRRPVRPPAAPRRPRRPATTARAGRP